MNPNSTTSVSPTRTQFYRNYVLKTKCRPMSRQVFNNRNHSYGHFHHYKPKQLVMNPLNSINRQIMSVKEKIPIIPKPNVRLDLSRSNLSGPVKQNPDLKLIVEAYQLTLGRGNKHYDINDLIPIQYNSNESLYEKYLVYTEEVDEFVRKLELLSTLPSNELKENLKNWFNVMLLRSCWISIVEDDEIEMLPVSGHFAIFKDYRLEPLFAFAHTIHVMELDITEISLITTYQLLMGTTTFMTPNNGHKALTSNRRDLVLKLLYSYERERYPADNVRYARILTALSELAYISLKLSEINPN